MTTKVYTGTAWEGDSAWDGTVSDIQVSAADRLIGSTAGAGDAEEIVCTAAARTVLSQTTVGAMLATLGGQMKLTRVTAELTTGNLTATVNAHHVLTISGMTAARSFVIPAGTAEGDLISWECITAAPATLTYEMVLIGDTGVTLVLAGTDRTATADGAFRYLIASETGVLRWDATASKWRLIVDGRRPTNCHINNTAGDTIGTGAWEKILLNNSVSNNFAMADVSTNYRITVRRSGKYNISGFSGLALLPDQKRTGISAYINGSSVITSPFAWMSAATVGTGSCIISDIYEIANTQYIELWQYQDSGGNLNTLPTAGGYSMLNVNEIL